MNDRNLVIVFMEYVGWIEKIVELDDGKFQMVVVVYNWVVVNYENVYDNNKTWWLQVSLMNYLSHFLLKSQSFTFPMHIKQVLFVKDVMSPNNWKVVLHKELR